MAIAAGDHDHSSEYCGHSLTLDSQGQLWVCGLNAFGQLGLGDKINRNRLTKIPNFSLKQESNTVISLLNSYVSQSENGLSDEELQRRLEGIMEERRYEQSLLNYLNSNNILHWTWDQNGHTQDDSVRLEMLKDLILRAMA